MRPPPPSQEDAQTVAGRCTAWKSRDGGDISPRPWRFWLRQGPLPRPGHQRQEHRPSGLHHLSSKLAPQATACGAWTHAGLPL